MKHIEELSTLTAICNEVRNRGLSAGHLLTLSKIFGKRLRSALRLLRENRVKKYVFRPSGKTVWVVTGRSTDYHIIPAAEYCSCNDFFFRAVSQEIRLCYHLIAQKIAQATEHYELIEEDDRRYRQLIDRLKR